MIEIKDLQFAYAEGDFGLRVQSHCVSEGQRVCWVGRSGSGKTTLLHLMAGIFPPANRLVSLLGSFCVVLDIATSLCGQCLGSTFR